MPTISERIGQRLAGAAPPYGTSAIRHQWSDTLDTFRVPDLSANSHTAAAWIVCESPHIDEVTSDDISDRYPLRGQSGMAVTNALVDCGFLSHQDGTLNGRSVPIGCLVKLEVFASVKIVNACELPLQSEAYAQRMDDEIINNIPGTLSFRDWARLLRAFKTVRNLRVNCLAQEQQPLVRDILDDLRDRVLSQIEGGRVLLCGNTARACWRVSELPSENTQFIAHPSRNAWYETQRGNRSGQQSLKQTVRERLEWLLQAH